MYGHDIKKKLTAPLKLLCTTAFLYRVWWSYCSEYVLKL